MDRRSVLSLFAGVGAAGLSGGLSGCTTTTPSTQRSPIKLGLLVPATGANKVIGGDLEKGFRLYLDIHGGEMSGHKVELVVEDEGDSIASGTKALENLHAANVLAVVGVANTELLPSIRDLVEKKQVPLLAAHGSAADMSSAVYIWRTAFVNNEPGRAVGLYMKSHREGKVGLIGLKDPKDKFSKDAIEGLQKEHGNFWPPVDVEPTAQPTAGYLRNAVDQLLGYEPSSIFCALPATYIVSFVQAVRERDSEIKIYAPGLASETLNVEQLQAAKLLYTAMQYSSDLDNPANRAFSAQYQARHAGSPTAFSVASYDAAAVLDGAIALCGDEPVSSLRINQEIPNVGQVISPRGNWQFNQARSPQQKWYLRQVKLDGPIWSNVLIGDLATLG